ncbi:hypothetical protein [Rhodococcus sp. I2R]|uniref:hypothetical protein n=1 Tax=Rhodococcus sp. I2R TaxID=2855445 RepID=UPI001E3BBA38|nr:hypothetical protein [Rhodococcus sp. I2R]MCC8927285.1 hypothetical protein [Rhodococcus sp. I2R]
MSETEVEQPRSVPAELTIRLLTPAQIGIATTDPLDVDLDVVVDDTGLPYIPRHRIAQRLREVGSIAALSDANAVGATTRLLGAARSTTGRRLLRIGHAHHPTDVRITVARSVAADRGTHGAAARLHTRIRDAYTTIVTSTQISDDGAPTPGTLRTVRAVRASLILHAPLQWLAPPTEADVTHLARLCVFLDQIGAGQSRGPGQIECALDCDREHTVALAFPTTPTVTTALGGSTR